MASQTVTRVQLAEAVRRESGLGFGAATMMVETVLGEIAGALERGEIVKISSFGTFNLRDKKERVGRNPKTLEKVSITPRRVVLFRPSRQLKGEVAGSQALSCKGKPTGGVGEARG